MMRVARDPFNTRERCGSLETEEGVVIVEEDHAGKRAAFIAHYIICRHSPAPQTPGMTNQTM